MTVSSSNALLKLTLTKTSALQAFDSTSGFRRWSTADVKADTKEQRSSFVRRLRPNLASPSVVDPCDDLVSTKAKQLHTVWVSPKKFPHLASSSASQADTSVGLKTQPSFLTRLVWSFLWALAALPLTFLAAQLFLLTFGPLLETTSGASSTLPPAFSISPGYIFLAIPFSLLMFSMVMSLTGSDVNEFNTKSLPYTFSGWFNDAYAEFKTRIVGIEQLFSSIPSEAADELKSAVRPSLAVVRDILVDMSIISKSLDAFLLANPVSNASFTSSNISVLSRAHDRLVVLEESFKTVFCKLASLEKEVISLAAFTAASVSRENLINAVNFSTNSVFESQSASVISLLESAEDFTKAYNLALQDIADLTTV